MLREMSSGGLVLPHPGGQVALGLAGLFCPGLPSVPGHERLRPLSLRLHSGEIHRHLSPHEGPGDLPIGHLINVHWIRCFSTSVP